MKFGLLKIIKDKFVTTLSSEKYNDLKNRLGYNENHRKYKFNWEE